MRVGVGEVRKLELMFVELVRGGMALGDWKCSETMVVVRFAPADRQPKATGWSVHSWILPEGRVRELNGGL